MAKAFSVASWNVEHFGDEQPSAGERLEFLVEQKPDVIGLYEVEGAEVWRELMDAFPGYSFFITEGENTQEILIGVSSELTGFVTQKIQFQDSLARMRPGAFLTIRLDEADYSLLFLHVASWTAPRGFGLRAEMIDKAFQFKRYLDERTEGGPSNFLFCGDLNTMGLDYVHGREAPPDDRSLIHSRFDAELEIERLRHMGAETGMRVLEKTTDVTWGKETGARSNLDHVVASEQLAFREFDGAEVDVRGWPELETKEEQAQWMSTFSDHALLYFELQRAG